MAAVCCVGVEYYTQGGECLHNEVRSTGFFDGLLLTHWKTPHDTHCHASSRGGCVCSPAVHRCYAGSRCSGTLPRRLLAACGGFYGRLSSESATVSPCVHISDLCPHSGDTMYALGTHVDFGLPRASLFLCWHRQYTPCNVYARLRPLSYCGDDSVFFVLDGADIGALAPV